MSIKQVGTVISDVAQIGAAMIGIGLVMLALQFVAAAMLGAILGE